MTSLPHLVQLPLFRLLVPPRVLRFTASGRPRAPPAGDRNPGGRQHHPHQRRPPQRGHHRAGGVVTEIRSLRGRVVDELKGFDVGLFDEIEGYVLATAHAHALYMAAITPPVRWSS